ncbi:MAG: hypothetical protein PWQ97_1464 [Tepidanaerobacteraceae bacterium]|nr:hypothetical protein [Tepidanaerobacteraceae bacterium]
MTRVRAVVAKNIKSVVDEMYKEAQRSSHRPCFLRKENSEGT